MTRASASQALYLIGLLLCVINSYWSIGFIVLMRLGSVIPRIPVLSRV